MTIEGIGPVDNIQKLNKTEKASSVSRTTSKDSVSISSDALQKSGNYYAVEVAKNAPDIRADKVAAAKARLEQLSENIDVLESVAEKLMQIFGV